MKLAELLLEKDELQRTINDHVTRLKKFALVQEGNDPPFKPEKLFISLNMKHKRLEQVIKTINHTNYTTEFEPGVSLADALVKRKILKSRHHIFEKVQYYCYEADSRYSKKEVKFVAAYDVSAINRCVDAVSEEFKLLDARLQAISWQIEVAVEA